MDNTQFGQADPADAASIPATVSRSGRAKRVVTTVAASAVLLGSGAAIGIALTGGASAATTSAASSSTAKTGGRCAKLEAKLQASDHAAAATRLRALCRRPLLRLALVGGEHGEVTFKGTTSPRTLAFERGTIESVTASAITVKAADGTSWTWDLTSKTAVRQAGHVVARTKLSNGERVFAGGPVVSGANDARVIRIRKAS